MDASWNGWNRTKSRNRITAMSRICGGCIPGTKFHRTEHRNWLKPRAKRWKDAARFHQVPLTAAPLAGRWLTRPRYGPGWAMEITRGRWFVKRFGRLTGWKCAMTAVAVSTRIFSTRVLHFKLMEISV